MDDDAQLPALPNPTIYHFWDTHVGEPTPHRPLSDIDKIAFARAVIEADRSFRAEGIAHALGAGRRDEPERPMRPGDMSDKGKLQLLDRLARVRGFENATDAVLSKSAERKPHEDTERALTELLDQMHHFANTDMKLWEPNMRTDADFKSWVQSRARHLYAKHAARHHSSTGGEAA